MFRRITKKHFPDTSLNETLWVVYQVVTICLISSRLDREERDRGETLCTWNHPLRQRARLRVYADIPISRLDTVLYCASLHLYSSIMYTSITGAFMFIAIEGNEALERFAQIPSKRVETAMRLWQISCCEVNVFNKTVFEERWVIFHQLCPQETPFIAVIVFVPVVIFLGWPSHGSWFNHSSPPTFHFLFPVI